MEDVICSIHDTLRGIGLKLNLSKCELAVNQSCANYDFSWWKRQNIKIIPMSELSIVGAPAHPSTASTMIRSKLRQASKKMDQFAALGSINPHLALLLGRFCGTGPKLAYWFRVCGALCSQDIWEEAEHSIASFVTSLIGPIGDTARKLLLLPPSAGGFGFHNFDKQHLAAASFASLTESSHIVTSLNKWCGDFLDASLQQLAKTMESLHIDMSQIPASRIQKHISKQLNEQNTQLVLEAGERVSCIANLARNKLASIWVAPDFDQMELALLPPASFLHYARFRLGEPLATDPLPCSCPTCDQVCDVFGDHALKCMRTGAKQKWHHALERAISTLASTALWRPDREPHPFATAPSRRLDIALPSGTFIQDKMTLIDVTVTHDLDLTVPRPPGHAATRKASEKHTTYGEFVDPTTQTLLPLPFETIGGHTKEVAGFLSRLSSAVAARHDAGRMYVPAVISSTITRAVADRLAAQFSRPSQIVEPIVAPQDIFSSPERTGSSPSAARSPEQFHDSPSTPARQGTPCSPGSGDRFHSPCSNTPSSDSSGGLPSTSDRAVPPRGSVALPRRSVASCVV